MLFNYMNEFVFYLIYQASWLKTSGRQSQTEALTLPPLMWSSWSLQERELSPSCKLFIKLLRILSAADNNTRITLCVHVVSNRVNQTEEQYKALFNSING